MRTILYYLLIYSTLLISAWSQVWFPGPGNLYLHSTPNGFKVLQLGKNGWEKAAKMSPKLVFITDSIRSGLNNASWQDQLPESSIVMAPHGEQSQLIDVESFWKNRVERHFHDYTCESTDILTKPLAVGVWLHDQQVSKFEDLNLIVKAFVTPGPTSNSMSYLLTHSKSGEKLLYSGSLVFDGARIEELYKFQDAIPEAGLRGYHGYAGRLSSLLKSYRYLKEKDYDYHFSSRGLIGSKPGDVFVRAEQKIVGLYKNYLSTSALHWYFGDKFLNGSFTRLGSQILKPPPPNFSNIQNPPEWVFSIGTTRIIHSSSGNVFLLDCGSRNVIDFIDDQIDKGAFKNVGGIFVTHYHDDHTDYVQKASEKYRCPVYVLPEYADLLKNPFAYHLPCLTDAPISPINVVHDGQTSTWEEFQFTYRFFPGQTWFHGALLVHLKNDPTEAILFAGDAFTPSGVDDYCLLNRNILNQNQGNPNASGYFQCLDILLNYTGHVPGYSKLPFYVANQHVKPIFSLKPDKLFDLRERLASRLVLLSNLMTKDSVGNGMDPYWYSLYPYIQQVSPGESFNLEPKIIHQTLPDSVKRAEVTVHFPKDLLLDDLKLEKKIGTHSDWKKVFRLHESTRPGIYTITSSIKLLSLNQKEVYSSFHKIEAIIIVE